MLGSAAIGAAITSRLSAHLPQASAMASERTTTTGGALPAALAQPFTQAMAEAIVVPAVAYLVGLLLVQLFARPGHPGVPGPQ